VKRAVLFLLVATLGLSVLANEGLPDDAPRAEFLITVDVSTNQLYVFREGQLVRTSKVATGSDKLLRKGGRIWWFRTPRGLHHVVERVRDPIWTKPDWAFLEEGKRIPPPDSPKRRVPGKLGKYALDLGGGILLHGTDDPKSIGQKASHGCIRLPDDAIAFLYREAKVGTPVYIFASQPDSMFSSSTGLNDLEMTVE
jgi:L,D-transpeptidase ErfK/SrfK